MKETSFFKWLGSRILHLVQYIGIWVGGFLILLLIVQAIPGTSHIGEDGIERINGTIGLICMLVPLVIIILIIQIRKFRKQMQISKAQSPLNTKQPLQSVQDTEVVEPEVVGQIDINSLNVKKHQATLMAPRKSSGSCPQIINRLSAYALYKFEKLSKNSGRSGEAGETNLIVLLLRNIGGMLRSFGFHIY